VAPLEITVSIDSILVMSWLDVLGRGPLAASTADADAVDNVALLGLVSETASLVGAGRTAGTVDDLQLAELSMHSQQCSTSTPIETGVCLEGFNSYLPALSQC
jgi:hypothetical protein